MTVGGLVRRGRRPRPPAHPRIHGKARPALNQPSHHGPWTHGGWSRGDGDTAGNLHLGSKTAAFCREFIEFPFFEQHRKGKGYAKMACAWVFAAGSDDYLSAPNRPAPYLDYTFPGIAREYRTGDQRVASQRPDVPAFEPDPIPEDLTIAGPVEDPLLVSASGSDSISGTNSAFVVKLIDIYPGDYPTLHEKTAPQWGAASNLSAANPCSASSASPRETPVPFVPDQPDRVEFFMPD